MKILSSIKYNDATYQAREIFEKLRTRPYGPNMEIECFDLESFTDRLPLSLQKVIVNKLFGSEVADCWASIMIEPVRHINDKGELKEIIYGRGQPMGLLSS